MDKPQQPLAVNAQAELAEHLAQLMPVVFGIRLLHGEEEVGTFDGPEPAGIGIKDPTLAQPSASEEVVLDGLDSPSDAFTVEVDIEVVKKPAGAAEQQELLGTHSVDKDEWRIAHELSIPLRRREH